MATETKLRDVAHSWSELKERYGLELPQITEFKVEPEDIISPWISENLATSSYAWGPMGTKTVECIRRASAEEYKLVLLQPIVENRELVPVKTLDEFMDRYCSISRKLVALLKSECGFDLKDVLLLTFDDRSKCTKGDLAYTIYGDWARLIDAVNAENVLRSVQVCKGRGWNPNWTVEEWAEAYGHPYLSSVDMKSIIGPIHAKLEYARENFHQIEGAARAFQVALKIDIDNDSRLRYSMYRRRSVSS